MFTTKNFYAIMCFIKYPTNWKWTSLKMDLDFNIVLGNHKYHHNAYDFIRFCSHNVMHLEETISILICVLKFLPSFTNYIYTL